MALPDEEEHGVYFDSVADLLHDYIENHVRAVSSLRMGTIRISVVMALSHQTRQNVGQGLTCSL